MSLKTIWPALACGIWIPLAAAGSNGAALSSLSNLIPPMLSGIAAAILVYGVSFFVYRSYAAAGLFSAIAVLGFWGWSELRLMINGSWVVHWMLLQRYDWLLTIVLVVGLGYLAVRWLERPFIRYLSGISRFCGVLSALALVSAVWSMEAGSWPPSIEPKPSALEAAPESPDVFIIVLDSYAGAASLKRHDFDNSSFVEALQSRGFVAPPQARSNYTLTLLSLASMLNWDYAQNLVPSWPPPSEKEFAKTILFNHTFRELLTRGYELAWAPSSLWFLRQHPWATYNLGKPVVLSSEFSAFWVSMTPIPQLRRLICRVIICSRPPSEPIEDLPRIQSRLAAISQLPAESRHRPRLVFAHLMLTHDPYYLTPDCLEKDPYPSRSILLGPATADIKNSYLDQLTCANTLILNLVDQILSNSKQRPIIILQGDHGQRYGLAAQEGLVNPEWFDTFAAYLIPPEREAALYDAITPMEAFRAIFDVPGSFPEVRPSIRQFMSQTSKPFTLTPWNPE